MPSRIKPTYTKSLLTTICTCNIHKISLSDSASDYTQGYSFIGDGYDCSCHFLHLTGENKQSFIFKKRAKSSIIAESVRKHWTNRLEGSELFESFYNL